MLAVADLHQWRELRKSFDPHATVGVVPTMGNLHQGHGALIERSKRENAVTIVTLFINPTQFNNPEDFKHYPQTLAADLAYLQQLNVDYCLHPTAAQVYPDNFSYQVTENKVSTVLEGVARPGHFTGMLTVVLKLLLLTQPQRAYFGEKDYQQLQLVQGMVKSFFIACEIIACPTVREASQLALSSRNSRLTSAERHLAEQFATLFHSQLTCNDIKQQLQQLGIQVDYLEEYQGRRFAAVYIGSIRLIDNYSIEAPSRKKIKI